MAQGKKTGGRKAGTQNRKTKEVLDTLAKLKCDPIEGLARIANGEPLRCGMITLAGVIEQKIRPSLEQRLTAFKELAQYVAPKRKAVEHSGSIASHEELLDELD